MLDCGTWKKGLLMTQRKPVGHRPENKRTEPEPEIARLSTIIASLPGIAGQSLRTTLESLPSVQVVGTAAGCLSALQKVLDTQADLIVIDANLPLEDVQVLLQQLKEEGLEIRSLVLAATSAQVRHALAAGADVSLRRDISIEQLGAVVEGFRPGVQRRQNGPTLADQVAGRAHIGKDQVKQ